jgi:hypothetical protein
MHVRILAVQLCIGVNVVQRYLLSKHGDVTTLLSEVIPLYKDLRKDHMKNYTITMTLPENVIHALAFILQGDADDLAKAMHRGTPSDDKDWSNQDVLTDNECIAKVLAAPPYLGFLSYKAHEADGEEADVNTVEDILLYEIIKAMKAARIPNILNVEAFTKSFPFLSGNSVSLNMETGKLKVGCTEVNVAEAQKLIKQVTAAQKLLPKKHTGHDK